MSIWCWHKWTKWVKTGDIQYLGKIIGFAQERHCEKCGFTQSDKTYQV